MRIIGESEEIKDEEIENDKIEENHIDEEIEEVFDEEIKGKEDLQQTYEDVEQTDSKELLDTRVIKRELINKILVIGLITVIIVVTSCIAGIIISKAHNEKMIKQYYASIEENMKIIKEEEEKRQKEEEERRKKYPIYEENAKNRMNNIYSSENEEKIAYLTFDDGPSKQVTPQILQILQEEGIKATFFVLGSRVERFPELLKQEYESGHYIANHGYSHDYGSIYSSPNAVLDEYNHTESLIKRAIGHEEYNSYLFRFPGGSEGGKYADIKNEAKGLLQENNIAYINWNSLTSDAVGHPTYESIVNDLKSSVEGKNKIVVLMHDAGTKQLTADTLRENISYLREQGYTFRTFYDIMCK